MATGDIFSFAGRFFFRYPYLITLAYPLETFFFISSCSASIASSAQVRGVVLGVKPHLCVPIPILPHSMQDIPLVNRRQLTLSRCVIMLYLLVEPICTNLRIVLVPVLEEGSNH